MVHCYRFRGFHVKTSLKEGVDGSGSGPQLCPGLRNDPYEKSDLWISPQVSFSTLHTAEVGASEEVWSMLQEWASPLGKSVPFCSIGSLSRSHSWAMCGLNKIQELDLITATERREQDPRQSHTRQARPGADHKTCPVWCKLKGVEVWGAGGEVENPGRQPTKWLLANGIKKVSKHFKNFKNCQRWQMHKAGSPSTHGAAPLCSRGCPGGQDTASSHSEGIHNPQRQQRCHQTTAGIAPPGVGASGLRF